MSLKYEPASVPQLPETVARGAVPEVSWCLRLIDSCITQLKAQGPSRTCSESNEEEEEEGVSCQSQRTVVYDT